MCRSGDPCDLVFNDSTWRSLHVLHDYGIDGTFGGQPWRPGQPPPSMWLCTE